MQNLGRIIIFLFLIFPLGILHAQKNKITKIITPYLFILDDGSAVKMAGISAPENAQSNAALKDFFTQVTQYTNEALLRQKFVIVRASDSVYVDEIHAVKYTLVYITKEYPFGSKDINLKYLEMGYARFRNNVDDIHRKAYIEAENSAYEQQTGFWRYVDKKAYNSDYRKYKNKILWNDTAEDSVFIRPVPAVKKASRFKQVMGELLLGSLFIPAGAIAGGVIGYGLDLGVTQNTGDFAGLGGILIGGCAGAVIGSSLGIYIVAHNYNPRVSFYNTISAGILGAAAGFGICSTSRENADKYGFTAVLLPVLMPLIYVNMVSDDYTDMQNNQTSRQQWNDDAGSMSFKDIRARDMMNVNVLHLSF